MAAAVVGAVGLLVLRFLVGLPVAGILDLKAGWLATAGLPWWTLSPGSSEALTACGLGLWVLLGFLVYHSSRN